MRTEPCFSEAVPSSGVSQDKLTCKFALTALRHPVVPSLLSGDLLADNMGFWAAKIASLLTSESNLMRTDWNRGFSGESSDFTRSAVRRPTSVTPSPGLLPRSL
jgi:hypothetical protein